VLQAQQDELPRLSGSDGAIGDDRFSLVYDARTGELSAESPPDRLIISLGLFSDAGIFTRYENLQLWGSFDMCSLHEVGDYSFGMAPSFSFGAEVEPGIAEEFLLGDLRYVNSVLPWQLDMPEFDLVYISVPEPSTLALAVLGLLSIGMSPRSLSARCSRRR
jgi:hypothetical protein